MGYESQEIHPRVATWLNRRNFPYIHEYRQRVDFLTINPQTGQVAIIECKQEINITSHVIHQINGYYRAVGIPSAERICITMTPLRLFQKEELEMSGIKYLIFGEMIPKTPCLPVGQARPMFEETWHKFNTLSLDEFALKSFQEGYVTPPVHTVSDKRFRELYLMEVAARQKIEDIKAQIERETAS